MRNPFEYGGVVGGDAFCNREKELSRLRRAIENREKLFIYSERRLGKSSLVLLALEKLPKREFMAAYVDLLATDGETSFVTTTAKAIVESMSTTVSKLMESAKALFGRLRPSVTTDEQGKPSVTFDISGQRGLASELDEVLRVPGKIADDGRRGVVIVFDEIQQIMEYESNLLERRLRSVIQKQRNVSYIFLGSRKHLIQKMFLDKSRPLYRAAGHYPLGPISTEHWLPFIRRKFLDARKGIDEEAMKDVCKLTQGHPFYTQHLCHALWELCDENAQVSKNLIALALRTLLDRESTAYSTLWDSLALNQKRFLKGLAGEEEAVVRPFSAEFIYRYGLGSASNVQRAIQPLLQRDVIDRSNGSFLISDRFFKIWVQTIQEK